MFKRDAAHEMAVLFKSYSDGFDTYLNLVRDKNKFGGEEVEALRLNAENALREYVDALGSMYYTMEQEIESALKNK